jgi:hypothetical protein
MDGDPAGVAALQAICATASRAKGKMLKSIIDSCLKAPNIFVFSELFALESVQQVRCIGQEPRCYCIADCQYNLAITVTPLASLLANSSELTMRSKAPGMTLSCLPTEPTASTSV